ncbi:carbohydrate-binding family 9-like protein [Victivallis sp. Marseille-Q1083]|uniref:carbohydrate-binding family 9-like protein n=1 Tax=Victivallis sp. Marseille-Q1083 TaxID=2717288 RepID=UPI00158C3576|nr:carbohydrate-binding family 9-like protein [Victivallis sp. Marseille-Q1083]
MRKSICLGCLLSLFGAVAGELPFANLGNTIDPACGTVRIPKNWTEYVHPVWNGPATPTNEDRTSGYLLWAPHYMETLSPYQQPDSLQLCPALQLFASPGEYEPAVLAVRPETELTAFQVELAPLRSASGAEIPVEHLEMRIASELALKNFRVENSYFWRPELLECFSDLTLRAGRTSYFWLTVHVPPSAAPGDYRSEVVLRAAGKPDRRVPLILHVWPIELAEPEMELGMYLGGHQKDLEMRHQFYRDMKAHGINTVAPCNFSFPLKWEDNHVVVDCSLIDREVKLCREVGFQRPLTLDMRPVEGWLSALQDEMAAYRTAGKEFPANYTVASWEFNVPPKYSEFEVEQTKNIIAQVEAFAAANNWPELYWLPQEEATNAAAKIQQLEHYARLFHANGVKVASWSNGPWGGVDELQPLDEFIDVRYYNSVTPELMRQAKATGDFCGIYNHGDRAQFGFFAERVQADGAFQWAYIFMDTKDAFSNGTLDYINSVVYPGDTGPIPSPMWERIREGIDDQRYITTLKKLLQRAENSDDGQARQLAAEIQTEFNMMLAAMPDETAKLYRWLAETDPALFDLWRNRIAAMILRLQGQSSPILLIPAAATDPEWLVTAVPAPADEKKTGMQSARSATAEVVVPKVSGLTAWPLAEGDWAAAAVIDNFLERYSDTWKKAQAFAAGAIGEIDGVPAREQTRVQLMYDDEYLYIRAKLAESQMERLVAMVTERNGAVYSDDSFELFFVPDPSSMKSLQVAVNALGTLSTIAWDVKGDDRQRAGEWQPNIAVQAGKLEDSWYAVLRIPFAAFGLAAAPVPGSNWQINFGREQQRLPEFSTWSQVNNSFHELHNYGTLYFDMKPAVSLQLLDTPRFYLGSNVLSLQLEPNRPEKFEGELRISVTAPSGTLPPVTVPVKMEEEGGKLQPEFPLHETGSHEITVSLTNQTAAEEGHQLRVVGEVPPVLELHLMQQELAVGSRRLRARLRVNRSQAALEGCQLQVKLNGPADRMNWIDAPLTGEQELRMAVADLPAGKYRLSVELVDATGCVAARESKSLLIEDLQ